MFNHYLTNSRLPAPGFLHAMVLTRFKHNSHTIQINQRQVKPQFKSHYTTNENHVKMWLSVMYLQAYLATLDIVVPFSFIPCSVGVVERAEAMPFAVTQFTIVHVTHRVLRSGSTSQVPHLLTHTMLQQSKQPLLRPTTSDFKLHSIRCSVKNHIKIKLIDWLIDCLRARQHRKVNLHQLRETMRYNA